MRLHNGSAELLQESWPTIAPVQVPTDGKVSFSVKHKGKKRKKLSDRMRLPEVHEHEGGILTMLKFMMPQKNNNTKSEHTGKIYE